MMVRAHQRLPRAVILPNRSNRGGNELEATPPDALLRRELVLAKRAGSFQGSYSRRGVRVQLGLIFCYPALCGQSCGKERQSAS